MKIKVTNRGRVVIYLGLYILVVVGISLTVLFVLDISSFEITEHYTPPTINCVTDTVLQPDGSCLPMER